MGKQIVLEGEGIATGYRQGKQLTEVHHGLDFSLSGGELTCLLGCNGAGKSTLLRTLAGMQPPLSGRLELMGRPLEAYSAHERSKTIGVVLTDRMQAGGLTVYELVALGRQPYTGFFGRLTSADKALVWRALEEVGMAGKARRYVAELSDGERQKAMIAKVLVQECPLILLDAFHARCGSGLGHVRPLMADDAGTRDAVWDDRGLGAVGGDGPAVWQHVHPFRCGSRHLCPGEP